jgi:hypothetical protein
MDSVFPWPSRRERKAAIGRATAARVDAEAMAAHGERVRDQIAEMAARNGFAAAIAEQITARHLRGEGR